VIQRFAAEADSYESSCRVQRGGLQGFPLDGGNTLAEALRLELRPFREQALDDDREVDSVLRLELPGTDPVQFGVLLMGQGDARVSRLTLDASFRAYANPPQTPQVNSPPSR
jgi:hypothetical protein